MARKTIWDFALNISGKGTEASQAIRTVKKQIEDLKAASDQLGKDWKNFTGNATKLTLGVAGGVAAAATGVVSMANSFAEAGDKAAKTSAALGVGIEAYQELGYAMGQSGVSAQEFDSALQKFNLTVRNGAAGNEAMQKQLADVGLSARKLAMVPAEQALEEISNHMQTLSNDAERTRVAVALFGKTAGPKMMAAMAQGGEGLRQLSQEARDLGLVISDEQTKQATDYGDAQMRLMKSFNGMKNQFIGSAIAPLTEAFNHLTKAVVEQMPAIREVGKAFGQWLGNAVKRLPEIIDKIKEFGSWVKNTVAGVKDFVGGWKNLAKILAGLAMAPTFISGLKTVWSLGGLVKTAMGAWPKILAKIAPAFGGVSAAALPIIGIIAGIAAAVFLIIKNWDKVKPVLINAVNGIKDAVGKVIEFLAALWEKHGESVMAVIGKITDIITDVFAAAWTILSTAVGVVAEAIGGFIGLISDCVGWLSEHETVLGIAAIAIGTVTTAIIAYNVAQAIANAGGIVAVARMGAQAIATGALSAATGVWSAVSSVAAVATSAFGAAMTFLTSPITLVVLAIGAVIAIIYLLIKNWDKVKEVAVKVWDGVGGTVKAAGEFIKETFGKVGEFFTGVWNGVKDAAGKAWGGIGGTIKAAGEFIKNFFFGMADTVKGVFQRIDDFVNNIIGALPEPFQKVFAGIKIVIDGFVGFWKNVFSSGINAIKNIVSLLPNLFADPIGTIKAIIGEIGGFFKNVFQGAVNAVKGIIDGLAEKFGGVFASLKEKIEGFANFFTGKFEGVKNFFGGIGNAIGGVFGGRDAAVPGHASGGIFTQPHIAQIAEQGAEAVVPLNRTSQGFGVWRQAGELGGYLKTASEQTPAVSAAAPVAAAAPPVKSPESSPVMAAASQKISSGDTAVRVDFKMTNNFNGGAPDREAAAHIAEAGQKAGEDFKAKVESVFEELMRDRRRASYA